MNLYKILYIFLLLLTLSNCKYSKKNEDIKILEVNKTYPLNTKWKFIADNHPDFALTDFDDTNWKEMPVPGYWRHNGYLNIRHGWYRLHFFIGSEYTGKAMGILVPGIFEGYELFINGHLIGRDGDFDDDGNIMEPINRTNFFSIETKYIHPNQTNVIALHVYDNYNFGAITGNFFIGEQRKVRSDFLLLILKSASINGFILIVGIALFIGTVGKKEFISFFLFSIILINSSFYILFLDRISGWFITNFKVLNYSLLIPSVLNSAAYIFAASIYFQQRLNVFGRILIYSFFPLFIITILSGISYIFMPYRNFIVLPSIQLYALLAGLYTGYLLFKAMKAKKIIGINYITLGAFVLILNSVFIILEINSYLSETLLSFSFLFFFFCLFYALSLQYSYHLESERELALNFQKKLEEEVRIKTNDLARTNKELNDANQMRDRLFSIIGHDLRSPLDTLKILLNLFHNNKFSAEELKRYVIQLTALLESSQLLLENLLNWASAQIGYKEVSITKFDLLDICKESYKLFMYKAKSKNITMRILADNSIIIQTDKNIIQMVLNNLVSNAIKFTEHSGRIDIQIIETETHVEISVIDTGIGIDISEEDFLEQTEIYLRTGTEGERSIGIGLQICKVYLKKINSRLFYEKKPEGGSIFSFYVEKN